jgi:hypothetical protein
MNTIATSTCDRCGHWNCDDCILFKDGKEMKKKKGNGKGEMSWVDILFPIKEKKGAKGREKGKDRES